MPEANNTDSNNGASGQPGSAAVNTNGNQGGNTAPSSPAGQPASAPAPQPHTPAPVQNPSSAPGPNFGEVLTAIQAMPERIVQGLREATQQAQQPCTASQSTGDQGAGNGAQNETQSGSRGNESTQRQTPGKKSFAEWWFRG